MVGKAACSSAIAARQRELAEQQHAAGVAIFRGQLGHHGQHADVGRLVAKIGHHGPGQVAGLDGVEQFRRAHDVRRHRLVAVGAGEGGEGIERKLAEPGLGAGDLAVIGGRIARGLLVALFRLLVLVQRFGRAAGPIGAARERDRVFGALRDLGEMGVGGARIVQVAKRDPAGHELVLGAIVAGCPAAWRRGRRRRRPWDCRRRAACGPARGARSTIRRDRGSGRAGGWS